MARLRRLAIAAGWGVILAWAPASVVLVNLMRVKTASDFGIYYAAAETLRYTPQANIYSVQTLIDTVQAYGGCSSIVESPYLYQPLTALLFVPATFIPCQLAASLWAYLNFALWFGLIAVLARQVWLRHGAGRAMIVALACLTFTPVLSGIHLGQTHLIVLLSMLVGAALIERDHELVGGATLSLGIMLKYLPAVLVLYYLLRGRWRSAVSASAVTLALVGVESLTVGPQSLIESVTFVAPHVRAVALYWEGGHWMSALPGGVGLAALAGCACVVIVVWLQLRVDTARPNAWLGAWWSLTTLLIISPLVWWFYMTWLLPALLTCLDILLARAATAANRWTWRTFIWRWAPVAVLALSYDLMLQPAYDVGVTHFRLLAAGAFLLWLLCGALYLRSAGVRLPSGFPSHVPARRRSSALIMKGSG